MSAAHVAARLLTSAGEEPQAGTLVVVLDGESKGRRGHLVRRRDGLRLPSWDVDLGGLLGVRTIRADFLREVGT